MTKLTKAMRGEITACILNKVRTPCEVALRARSAALAIRLLRARYGDDVFERCRALPEGWLQVEKYLNLDHSLTQFWPNHSVRNGRYCGRLITSYTVELAEYAPLPANVRNGWDATIIKGKLLNDLHALFAERVDLARELESLEIQLRATLASFTTVERLADGWPEGYAELPQELLAPAGSLPAPRIEDLNARIAALSQAA